MPGHIDYPPESLRWRKRVEQEMMRETPYQWAQRLLVYADELADIEPHMAMTMRVCGVLIEQANFYNSLDVRQTVDHAQDQIVDDCLFVVRHLTEQGAQDQARGALEVVKHLAGFETPPKPAQAPQPQPAAAPSPRPNLSLPPPKPAPSGGSLSASLLSARHFIRCFPT
jgi:hypothetical protein